MKIMTVTASTGYPIDLEEVKDHLRLPVGDTRQDAYLTRLIKEAAEEVEDMTNRALTRRTLRVYFDEWPYDDGIELPYPPLSTSVDAIVKYKDVDSSTITLSSTAYLMDAVSDPGRIVLDYNEDWPSEQLHNVNPIYVQYQCGYNGSSNVPEKLKQAMLLLIGDKFEFRESLVIGQSVSRVPDHVESLVRNFKSFKFGA